MSDSCCCSCGHEHHSIVLPVKGMQCEKCEARLEKALNAIPGVHATADHELGCVKLMLHEEDSINKIKETIVAQGFEL